MVLQELDRLQQELLIVELAVVAHKEHPILEMVDQAL
jgi:hypothetical protein